MNKQKQEEEARRSTWVMGTPTPPDAHRPNPKATSIPVEFVPTQPTAKPAHMNYTSPDAATTAPQPPPSAFNVTYPYVQVTPVPGSSSKCSMDTIVKVLSRCGKKLEITTRKAGSTAENVWHHLKTGPSLTDAAMARLSQGTKVLAEGGYDKMFQQTFGGLPGEKLHKAYACYLSTSAGPVIGTLYLTNQRLAFCSDNPLCRNVAPGQQEWVYYKVVVQLDRLAALHPSTNKINPTEKYIQIITVDGNEFWFMGFVSYDKALKNLSDALKHSTNYPSV